MAGKAIRNSMLLNSPGGENHHLCILLRCLWKVTVKYHTDSVPQPEPTTGLSDFDWRKKVNMME